MKKLLTLFAAISMLFVACSKDDEGGTSSNPLPPMSDPEDVCTAMDDIDFMKYCYTFFDVNKDGKVSIAEAEAVQVMEDFYCRELIGTDPYYGPSYKTLWEVTSLKGIEYFKNVTTLSIDYCQISQKEVDLSRLTKLHTLRFGYVGTSKLCVAGNYLSYIYLFALSSLDLYVTSITPCNLRYIYLTPGSNIYVPYSAVDAYKTTEGWKEYADRIYGY